MLEGRDLIIPLLTSGTSSWESGKTMPQEVFFSRVRPTLDKQNQALAICKWDQVWRLNPAKFEGLRKHCGFPENHLKKT